MPVPKTKDRSKSSRSGWTTEAPLDTIIDQILAPQSRSLSTEPSAPTSELTYVKGIGPKRAEALAEAGFNTVLDLVYHFPVKSEDARTMVKLADLRKYVDQAVTVHARVLSSQFFKGRGVDRVEVVLTDASTGRLSLVFFRASEWRAQAFKPGDEYLISGYVGEFRGHLQIVHPHYLAKLEEGEGAEGKMIPMYRVPAKLVKANLHLYQFQRCIRQALAAAQERKLLREILPPDILDKRQFASREASALEIHMPTEPEKEWQARRRMKYEELFFLQLRLAVERRRNRLMQRGAVRFDVSGLLRSVDDHIKPDEQPSLPEQIVQSLPYKLTGDQKNALREIAEDMAKKDGREYAMNRLLQGDVGSGKTIVALLAMLSAIENGYQCALMVPTEVLASQHLNTLTKLLKGTYVNVSLLIGDQTAKERRSVLAAVESGETHIVIGTHALIEKGVQLDQLGLVIIDEQHRFGVAQRKALIEKTQSMPETPSESVSSDLFRASRIESPIRPRRKLTPDVLIMTATPIPRTLALTLYGDIAISSIKEMPLNRGKLESILLYEQDHPAIYRALIRRVQKGEQGYIVYPLREASDSIMVEAAMKAYEELRHGALKELRLGLIHGKMSSAEKQETMRKFREKEFDVLVATTVIEVGIDVPNATVMIIEHADRFGLAQLHQLRGRVGRGSAESACVVVASDSLKRSESANETSDQIGERENARYRLEEFVKTKSGFDLALLDLKLRGHGDLLGQKQSGRMLLKIANLATDSAILEETHVDIEELLDRDPHLRGPDLVSTREAFIEKYRDAESFLHVG